MALSQKERVRIAHALRDALQRRLQSRQRYARSQLECLTGRLKSLEHARSWLQVCDDKGWTAAASRILKDMPTTIAALPHDAIQVQEAVRRCRVQAPSVRDVCRDLDQAEDEFGEVTYDPKEACVSVCTGFIELEDIALGEFKIELNLDDLGELHAAQCYRVIAQDPNPAQGRSGVTHPHVSEERLCAGDATLPIETALADGRICDFFLLVQSVLTTYNRHSPYVALEEWEGEACYDCGRTIPNDDTFWCELCQNVYCQECVDRCARCDDWACKGCLAECPACGEYVCAACMTSCGKCGAALCERCLNDGLCDCVDEDEDEPEPKLEHEETLHEREEDNDDDTPDEQPESGREEAREEGAEAEAEEEDEFLLVPACAAGLDAAVLAHRVGEAAVLPGPRAH